MELLRKAKNFVRQLEPGNERLLDYVHIGKCGGSSVGRAIERSPIINSRFVRVKHTHGLAPVYKPKTKYLFVVRNPIERAISAFNWRHRLVLTGGHRDQFPGEFEVLTKYGSLDALATALYNDGELVPSVAKEYRTIHHLREGISFYLEGFYEKITPGQIFAVLCQSHLDEDIERFLGVSGQERVRENKSSTDSAMLELSENAHRNLVRFLQRDYDLLEKLIRFFPIDSVRGRALLAT